MANTQIDPLAMNLTEWYQLTNAPLIKEITFSMIEAGNVFQDIPLITDGQMYENISRIVDDLPSINWAKINTDPVAVFTQPLAFTERKYPMRNEIQIDKVLMKDKNVIDGNPFDIQQKALLKSLSYDLNDKFINNSHGVGGGSVNLDCFVGLRSRLDATLTTDNIYQCNAACLINANGTSLTNTGQTAATSNVFLSQLQQLLDEMGASDGNNTVLYMNEDLLRRANKGIRMLGAGGGWDMTKDAFDRKVSMFNNAVVRNIGRKAPTTPGQAQAYVITSTETSAGADSNSTFTSVYGVTKGRETFCATQMYPIDVTEPQLLQNKVTYQSTTDWVVGLRQKNTRAIGRLFDLNVAPS